MEISISTVIVSKYVYSAVISTISLDRLLLMQPMLLMIGANAPAGSDDRIGQITTVLSKRTCVRDQTRIRCGAHPTVLTAVGHPPPPPGKD
jgi:hypothetical protein